LLGKEAQWPGVIKLVEKNRSTSGYRSMSSYLFINPIRFLNTRSEALQSLSAHLMAFAAEQIRHIHVV
jgi:hypothetical protein